jgi:S1/P1 Nuclease
MKSAATAWRICGSALLVALLAARTVNDASAWGTSGHSIVAEIAQRRLEPGVLRKIKELLGGEVSLASVASWADDVILARPDTVNWHFVNIPYEASNYDPARDCRETSRGDCVVEAIRRLRLTLMDVSKPKQERTEALMFLVHFVADVHQPLHCAERNGDQGGNTVNVIFFGHPMTLHMVWDVGILDKRSYDWGEHVRYLEAKWLREKNVASLEQGTPADWAVESHQAAVAVAYQLPSDMVLGEEYYRRSMPTVDRQLALAGLRLARLLNDALSRRGALATGNRGKTGHSRVKCPALGAKSHYGI